MTQSLLLSLTGEPALPTWWFWTSCLYNYKGINFCLFKPLHWWFIIAVLGNWDNVPFNAFKTLGLRPTSDHLRSDYYSGSLPLLSSSLPLALDTSLQPRSLFSTFSLLFFHSSRFSSQLRCYSEFRVTANETGLYWSPAVYQMQKCSADPRCYKEQKKHDFLMPLVRNWESLPSLHSFISIIAIGSWRGKMHIVNLNFHLLDLQFSCHPNFPFFGKISW